MQKYLKVTWLFWIEIVYGHWQMSVLQPYGGFFWYSVSNIFCEFLYVMVPDFHEFLHYSATLEHHNRHNFQLIKKRLHKVVTKVLHTALCQLSCLLDDLVCRYFVTCEATWAKSGYWRKMNYNILIAYFSSRTQRIFTKDYFLNRTWYRGSVLC